MVGSENNVNWKETEGGKGRETEEKAIFSFSEAEEGRVAMRRSR